MADSHGKDSFSAVQSATSRVNLQNLLSLFSTERNRSPPSQDVCAGRKRSTAEKGTRRAGVGPPVAGLRPHGRAVPGRVAGGQQDLAGHPGLGRADSRPCGAARNHQEVLTGDFLTDCGSLISLICLWD